MTSPTRARAPSAAPFDVVRWRLPPGVGAPRGAPMGVSRSAPLEANLEPGDALWIELRDLAPVDVEAPAAVARALPDPTALRGVPIVIAPALARIGLVARLVGRELRVARSVRGSALLLRGYVDVGGGRDPSSGLDLCWGVAPSAWV